MLNSDHIKTANWDICALNGGGLIHLDDKTPQEAKLACKKEAKKRRDRRLCYLRGERQRKNMLCEFPGN